MKKEHSAMAGESRRNFIKKTSVAAAAIAATGIVKTPVYGAATAPSTGRVIGANDRIAVAVIGVGFGIGQDHIMGIQNKAGDNNVVVAAGCDLFSKRRDWMMGRAEQYGRKMPEPLKENVVYEDYRKVLDRNDIDAVVIATHDVWHAPIAIQAMESGKHVYCEKPLTRYLGEAFQVYDTVKKTGKILQVGSQGCSAAGWHKAAELIQAGKIGPLIWGQGYYCRNNDKGEWNIAIDDKASAEAIDWQQWLGHVKKNGPFNPEYYFRWRKFYPFCAGLLGDLIPHRLHPLMVATGKPEFPSRVVSIGTKNVHPDKNTDGATERDVPEHLELIAEFPNGLTLVVAASTVNAKSPGFVIY